MRLFRNTAVIAAALPMIAGCTTPPPAPATTPPAHAAETNELAGLGEAFAAALPARDGPVLVKLAAPEAPQGLRIPLPDMRRKILNALRESPKLILTESLYEGAREQETGAVGVVFRREAGMLGLAESPGAAKPSAYFFKTAVVQTSAETILHFSAHEIASGKTVWTAERRLRRAAK